MKFHSLIVRTALPVLTAAFALLACQSCWSGEEAPKGRAKGSDLVETSPKTEIIEIPGREGKIRLRATVLNGKLEGLAERWWDDGIRMSRGFYRQGVLVDSFYSWNMHGGIHEISIYEDGNPISVEGWNSKGVKTFQSVRIKDSTYHTMRWNDAGEKTKDTLEIRPKVRWTHDAPSKDQNQGYEIHY